MITYMDCNMLCTINIIAAGQGRLFASPLHVRVDIQDLGQNALPKKFDIQPMSLYG